MPKNMKLPREESNVTRDKTRDKAGWKAARQAARRNKKARRQFEQGEKF